MSKKQLIKSMLTFTTRRGDRNAIIILAEVLITTNSACHFQLVQGP